MVSTPTAKHIAYKGRRYRIMPNGALQQWRTRTDSYEMAWLPFAGSLEIEEIIRRLAKEQQ